MINQEIIPALNRIEANIASWYTTVYPDTVDPVDVESDIYNWLDETNDADSEESILLSNILTTLTDYHLLDFNNIASMLTINEDPEE